MSEAESASIQKQIEALGKAIEKLVVAVEKINLKIACSSNF
jgi:hypothetical protein